MAQYGLRGSFLGFTFNNIHSSTLGITRTSDSDRYNDQLVPTLKDTTVSTQGIDGTLYYGSVHTKRDITVSFCFDGLTEYQLNRIRQVWNDKQIHDLIFDEWPYKIYSAKLTGTAIMKYLCFDEGTDCYKGEGNLTFTCYFPYARSRAAYSENYTADTIHSWVGDDDYWQLLKDAGMPYEEPDPIDGGIIYYDLDDYSSAKLAGAPSEFTWVLDNLVEECFDYTEDTNTMNSMIIIAVLSDTYNNMGEWLSASKIPSQTIYGNYDMTLHQYHLYNAGDLDMPFTLWFDVPSAPLTDDVVISCGARSLTLHQLDKMHGPSPTQAGTDRYIKLDMKNWRIEGYDQYYRPTGRLYNRFISDGQFFEIPTKEQYLYVSLEPIALDINYLYY